MVRDIYNTCSHSKPSSPSPRYRKVLGIYSLEDAEILWQNTFICRCADHLALSPQEMVSLVVRYSCPLVIVWSCNIRANIRLYPISHETRAVIPRTTSQSLPGCKTCSRSRRSPTHRKLTITRIPSDPGVVAALSKDGPFALPQSIGFAVPPYVASLYQHKSPSTR